MTDKRPQTIDKRQKAEKKKTMRLYHVVAVANRNVIGKDNRLPWHFSSDLKYFKALTLGSTVIMGRKTFESIGRPLPGRENMVLTRNPECHPEAHRAEGSKDARSFASLRMTENGGARFFSSLDEALRKVTTTNVFIIGGAELYRQTIDQVDGIYLTQIHADYEGDAFYPEIPGHFKERSRTLLQENPKIEAVFYEKGCAV